MKFLFWKWRTHQVDSNVVNLARCKNCHKKLKDKRHKLYNEKDLFIGYRCPKCYKKYRHFVTAYLLYLDDREKRKAFLQAYEEQQPRKMDSSVNGYSNK